MITAKIESRLYVPLGAIAVEFASLDFFGDKGICERLGNIAHAVEFEKYKIVEKKIESLNAKIQNKKNEIQELENEIRALEEKTKEIKKSTRLYFLRQDLKGEILKNNFSICNSKNEIKKINEEINSINNEIDKLKDERFYSAHILEDRFIDLLSNLGFSAMSSNCAKANDIQTTMYQYNGQIEKLNAKMKQYEKKYNINAHNDYKKSDDVEKV